MSTAGLVLTMAETAGWAEGDPLVVGIVVAALILIAVAYVVMRVRGRRRRADGPDRRDSRGR